MWGVGGVNFEKTLELSCISVIYEEDLKGTISSYSQGHPQQNECKFSANYACAFCGHTIYKAIVPNKIHGDMVSNGKMADYRGCVLGTVHYPGRIAAVIF